MDDYTRGLVAGVIIGAGLCLVFFGYLIRRFINGLKDGRFWDVGDDVVIDVHRTDGPPGS